MKPFFSSGITVSRRGSQRSLGGVSRGAFGSRPWPRPCLASGCYGMGGVIEAGAAGGSRRCGHGRHGTAGDSRPRKRRAARGTLSIDPQGVVDPPLYGIAAALNQGRQPTLLIEETL